MQIIINLLKLSSEGTGDFHSCFLLLYFGNTFIQKHLHIFMYGGRTGPRKVLGACGIVTLDGWDSRSTGAGERKKFD